MKKNLRLLCLGLAAATFTCSFAQDTKQDMTSLLKNPTMESGVSGWSFAGEKPMSFENKKTGTSHVGYHGMGGSIIQAWNGKKLPEGIDDKDAKPEDWYYPALSDSYTMQRLGDGELKNGTYVFGAYAGAALQSDSLPDSYKSIKGVYLFANEKSVSVATNNPEAKGLPQWAHTGKYNVAVTLTDDAERKGYLDVGIRTAGTNANFVMWDNATLWYFGDMSEEAALDEMAKIDFHHSVYNVADTLPRLLTPEAGQQTDVDTLVLDIDTLNNFIRVLNESKQAIEDGTVTAANLWDLNEKLYYNKGLVHKSVLDYTNLKNSIKNAQAIKDDADEGLWQEHLTYEDALFSLDKALEKAQEAYNKRSGMGRKELNDLRKTLEYAIGDVKYDSIMIAQNDLSDFIREADRSGSPYTTAQRESLKALHKEVEDSLSHLDVDGAMDADGDDQADYDEDGNMIYKHWEDRKINPNDIYFLVAKVYNAIQEVKDNPLSAEYTVFPIVFETNENGVGFVGSKKNDGWLSYKSPMYSFKNEVTTLRFKMAGSKESNTGNKYFTLSTLAFYNEDGVRYSTENGTVNHDQATKITTFETEDFTLATNADHNELNANDDGHGMAGLMDANKDTWYHSDYGNKHGGEDPYFEVTFKKGVKRFQFEMVARDGNRDNQFPNGMTIDLPTPNRDAMTAVVNTLKNLRAYSVYQVNEVGFYTQNFDYVLDIVAEAEALLASEPSEAACEAMELRLLEVLNRFNKEMDKGVRLPEKDKEYWIVSALPGFYNVQQLEKAITFHGTDSTLWWSTASIDSVAQKFVFEPIMIDGEEMIEYENGKPLYYGYFMKHVASNLYVSGSFTDENADGDKRVKFVANPDTIRLKSLGVGQWQLTIKKIKNGVIVYDGMDLYDNKNGNVGGKGDYGDATSKPGEYCHVGPWAGGFNSGSAFYIRQFDELPLTALVENAGDFKSELYHFAPANNIKLIADADCAFENLALCGLLGDTVAVDTVMRVDSKSVRVVTTKDIVECAFAFTAPEGVSKVTLSSYHYVSKLGDLMEAYAEAAEAVYSVGDSIGQYTEASVAAYLEALEAAADMIETAASLPENDESNKQMADVIKRIEKAEKDLEINLPEEGKYYHIVNAYPEFLKKSGYTVTLYADDFAMWGAVNDVDWTRYWQFERASKDELMAVGAPDSIPHFYIKNVGTKGYVGGFKDNFAQNTAIPMVTTKADAVPYAIKALGSNITGAAIALDAYNRTDRRLHANGHGNGSGKSGGTTYWNSGIESSSAWSIVEVEYDVTDIDFTEVEAEQPVVKGTFDLFGRRINTPTAPGIYIVDGKKKYIK